MAGVQPTFYVPFPSTINASVFSPSNAIHVVQENKTVSYGLALGLSVLFLVRWLLSPYRKLPPGPSGYPIIGSVLELRSQQWLKFTEWKKTYGDVVYLNAAGQPMVILNSQKVAADLLDRRAGIYSDRPTNVVASDIMTGGLLVVFTRYGDIWRRMRKAAHEGLNKGVVRDFHETQTTEAVLLANGGLAEPMQWDKHLRRTAASMVLSVVYDQPTIKDEQDPRVKDINDFVQRLTRAAYPGAHFVEFFPWMVYIPSRFAKWKRVAEEWYKKDSAMFEGLFESVKVNVAKGDEHPSLCATLIKDSERHQLSMRENSWLAGTMYAAGAETTSAVMSWWSLAMLAYPETQKRAQAELDAVVGRTRMPTFADLPHLPYIRAMVKEALRWRPVDPVGLPHRSIEDDWYEGMFIPAGTICIANVWHLNRDPEIYGADAHHFNPARHLDAKGELAPGPADTKEESHVTYGFGRRLCVGRHVANNSLFIDIAIMLWASNIERVKGPDGKPVPLDVDGFVEDGLVVRPIPFDVHITPRFPEAPALLASEKELRGH
ncbi:cytochrome P450 [Artomyces pyxidatus]|uniref:Cytochrome P450 n=1 Tax=Artomyces pyxidatus TaxID=48021 RepID=A0ACB8TEU7_9AGAM|nr:cytochrome P450 [Artomyces pyxidatus]